MLYIDYPSWLSPVIVPNLPFRWYAMMYLVAFALTYILFRVQVKQRKLPISSEQVMSLFFWAIIGMLIGARLFNALLYDVHGVYQRSPWLVFLPFNEKWQFVGFEGLSYHGAIVGIAVALFLHSRIKKINLLSWGDMIVYGAPLGYTFGRIGNFINGELWGRVTDAPWAILFPGAKPLATNLSWVQELAEKTGIPIEGGLVNLPRHPSQLYEALLEGVVLWLFMWFIFRKRNRFPGYGISWYLIGYGIARFIAEYFRQPDEGLDYIVRLGPADAPPQLLVSAFNLSMGQILCLGMVAAGVVAYRFFAWKAARIPSADNFKMDESKLVDQGKRQERRKTRKKLK